MSGQGTGDCAGPRRYYPKVTLDTHVSRDRPARQRRQVGLLWRHPADFGAFHYERADLRRVRSPAQTRYGRGRSASSGERTCWSARLRCTRCVEGVHRLRTALKKQDAAEKLLTASKSAFDAVLDSSKQGLSTYPEVVTAERNLTGCACDQFTIRSGHLHPSSGMLH